MSRAAADGGQEGIRGFKLLEPDLSLEQIFGRTRFSGLSP
jgi:hypothetical protein